MKKIFLSSSNWYGEIAERLALSVLYDKKRFFLLRSGKSEGTFNFISTRGGTLSLLGKVKTYNFTSLSKVKLDTLLYPVKKSWILYFTR